MFTAHGSGSIELYIPVRNVVYICYLYTPDDGRGAETCSVTVINKSIGISIYMSQSVIEL
jgi:hypothetical protein